MRIEERMNLGAFVCKTAFFVSNVASLFVNWSWVCMWGQRFLDVVRPLRRFTEQDSVTQTKRMLCLLLITAVGMELWGLLVVTEHRVDDIGGFYCDVDVKYAR